MSKFETERLLMRKIKPDDAEGLKEYALYKVSSGYEAWENWPTDQEGSKKLAEHLADKDNYWSVIRKSDFKFIGFISFNEVDDKSNLDMGHGFISEYNNDGEAVEAIKKMIQYAFDSLDIEAIDARNPEEWKEKVAPLKKIGFKRVDENRLQMTRDKWNSL
ncbi:GNAT family N-acetyltransferase [Natronospora cellulosivora (SeqCode)]